MGRKSCGVNDYIKNNPITTSDGVITQKMLDAFAKEIMSDPKDIKDTMIFDPFLGSFVKLEGLSPEWRKRLKELLGGVKWVQNIFAINVKEKSKQDSLK